MLEFKSLNSESGIRKNLAANSYNFLKFGHQIFEGLTQNEYFGNFSGNS